MKCKYAGAVAANSRLASKWIQHLRAKALREAPIIDAVGIWQRLFGHVERTEQKIPNRECAGEVLSAATAQIERTWYDLPHRPTDSTTTAYTPNR